MPPPQGGPARDGGSRGGEPPVGPGRGCPGRLGGVWSDGLDSKVTSRLHSAGSSKKESAVDSGLIPTSDSENEQRASGRYGSVWGINISRIFAFCPLPSVDDGNSRLQLDKVGGRSEGSSPETRTYIGAWLGPGQWPWHCHRTMQTTRT